ncbi:MAG: phosphate acyltransferase PlsX [Syntrophomonadaceae bacterium]|nr:phosphate acyltransferase PlsX [Syntrophomonadaceae bacterium]
MRIAVDVMGGDYAPSELIAGALRWTEEQRGTAILVGQSDLIEQELNSQTYDSTRVEIAHASQVVEMNESPAQAMRKKKDASIIVATNLVKAGQADALVSCGSTGAQMAAAIFILGRMKGIDRPPIVASLPNAADSVTLLIDVGANVDCKPVQLLQFALLGSAYAVLQFNKQNPSIALLNNGEEETKGNSVSVEAHTLLKQHPQLNFVGNLEGRDLFSGKVDVVLCDGFTGNIVLKTVEGLAGFIAHGVTRELGALPQFFSRIDYTKVGGAPLLGVNGISVVGHGSSRREAVYNAMLVAENCVTRNMVTEQISALQAILAE